MDKNKQYPLSASFATWQINKGYCELLKNVNKIEKKLKLLSIICSNKKELEGHRLRIKFTNICKEHFKERLDWFGSGYNFVEDKWDAIAPYKYHLVLENTSMKYYRTEKLSDAILAYELSSILGRSNYF